LQKRPDIATPYLNVTTLDKSSVSPGYIFISPFKNRFSGPLIFDHFGDLLWSGSEAFSFSAGPGPGVYVFEPNDDDDGHHHLCMLQIFNQGGTGRGQAFILNSAYEIVKNIHYNGTSSSLDLHEFRLVDNNNESGELTSQSALLTQYWPMLADLSDYDVPDIGWIYDSRFQEQRLNDSAVIFEWKASEHIDLNETAVVYYDGREAGFPWDWFHVNSIRKLEGENGDEAKYLISARHTSTIYLISGRDGSVLWRLGGRRSDFRMIRDWFYYPHDAALLRNQSGILTISVFDNGQTPHRKARSWSRGLVLSVNESARTVSIVQSYHTASVPRATEVGGSMEMLGNGNVLLGWGITGCFTEYSSAPDTRPVFEACVDDAVLTPALYRVRKATDAKIAVHMSWNGATEVASWRIYGSAPASASAEEERSRWLELGTYPRSGFETSALIKTTISLPRTLLVKVEALAADGSVLGQSDVARTFVPNSAADCDEMWCAPQLQQMKVPSTGIGGPREAWRETFLSWQLLSFALCALLMGLVAKRRIWRRKGIPRG
ncbi:hypothetical protein CERZMDRAFT_31767, partial [Cercospora zeae-maydis SCOH1-5]